MQDEPRITEEEIQALPRWARLAFAVRCVRRAAVLLRAPAAHAEVSPRATTPTVRLLALAALILVNVEQHSWRDARAKLRQLPGLHHLALTTGGFDFALLVRVPDVETLRDVVLDRLQGMAEVRSTQTVFVLDEDGGQRPKNAGS